jgi:hypothetical protein
MTDKRLLDPVARVLLDADNLIEEKGWWNGRDSPEGVCVEMAIRAVTAGKNDYVLQAVRQRLIEHVGVTALPRWNDRSDAATVIATLRAVAQRLLGTTP